MDFLKESRYSHSLSKLISYLKKFDDPDLRRFANSSIDVQSLAREPLKIVVAGEFNAGKSTFINALLKKEVMPTNVVRETVTVNKLSYGSEYGIEVFFKDEIRPPKKTLCNPENIIRHLKDVGNQADLISYINVYFDLPELKNFTIIDTPGLNFSDEETSLSLGVIKEADVLIWLTRDLKNSEHAIVKKLVPDIKAMVCLINYIDLHSKSDLSDLVEDVGKRGGEMFEKYFPVSAKQACDGYMADDSKCIEDSKINDFLYWIQNEIFGRHYQLIFERIKDKTIRIFGDIDEFVSREIAGAESGIDSVNKVFQNVTKKLVEEFSSLLETFKRNLQEAVDAIPMENSSVKVVLSHYIAAVEKKFKDPSEDGVFSAVKGELSIHLLLSEIQRIEADFLNKWEEVTARFRSEYPGQVQIPETLDLTIRHIPPTYVYAMYVCGAMHFAGMNAYLFLEPHEKMKNQKNKIWNELVESYSRLISETAKMFQRKTKQELERKKKEFEEIREYVNGLRQQDLQEVK